MNVTLAKTWIKKQSSIFPNKAVLNDSHFRMKLLSLQYGATMNAQTYVKPIKKQTFSSRHHNTEVHNSVPYWDTHI